MAQLVVNKTYADGQVLGEINLDNAFDSIENFINVEGLSAENIQDNSITAAELQVNTVTEPILAANAISTNKIQDAAVTLQKLAADVQALFTPVGSISAYGGDVAPSGYFLCDGTAISRATYSALFTLVGVRFGSGNGTTTFNLPDLRGRFLRGKDDATGRDPDAAARTAMNSGGATGDNVGSVQGDDMGVDTLQALYYVGAGATPNVLLGGANASTGTFSNIFSSTQTDSTGQETRPKNAYVNFIIKV